MNLEDYNLDKDVLNTCKVLLSHYNDMDDVNPSPKYIQDAVDRGVKESIDDLNHAIEVVDGLLHKAIVNDTSDIIQSFKEVDVYCKLIDESSNEVMKMKKLLEGGFNDFRNLYSNLESQKMVLERIFKLQLYITRGKEALLILNDIYNVLPTVEVTVSGFKTLLKLSDQYSQVLDITSAMNENTDLLAEIIKMTNEIEKEIKNKVIKEALLPFIYGYFESDDMIITLSHQILHVLKSNAIDELVDKLVNETSDLIDLKVIIASKNWKDVFLSQYIDFLALYTRNIKGLYNCWRLGMEDIIKDDVNVETNDDCITSTNSINLLQPSPRQFNLPAREYKSENIYFQTYFIKCIDLIKTLLSHLNKKGYNVSIIVPQLISLGNSTHIELEFPQVQFNISRYYYKVICDAYVKEYITIATQEIIPVCQNLFKDVPTTMSDLDKAAQILMNLILDDDIIDVMTSYLDVCKYCDILFKQVQIIVTSGLKEILNGVSSVKTEYGTRLILNDGGSRLILSKPNDAQTLNAKMYNFTRTLVMRINEVLSEPKDEMREILNDLSSLNLINSWCDDVINTVWHTFSFISNNNDEFKWSCNHVITTCQHVMKICNFLREAYLDTLIQYNKGEIFKPLIGHVISAFILYSSTIWPLNDDDKLLLLNTSTELEFTLSELTLNPIPKLEAEYISSFRSLIFLEDDNIDQIPLALSSDVVNLHLITRQLTNVQMTRISLHQHLGFESTSEMLKAFGSNLREGTITYTDKLQQYKNNLIDV